VTDEQRADWLVKIRAFMETGSRSRIIRYDETFWLLHPKGILTWAELGCQAVQTKINGNEKDCITVVAYLTAGKVTACFYDVSKNDARWGITNWRSQLTQRLDPTTLDQ
jgi:hypothetical protein